MQNFDFLSDSIEAGRLAAAEEEAEARVFSDEDPGFLEYMKPYRKSFWLKLKSGLLEPFSFGEMQTKYILSITSVRTKNEYIVRTLECASREEILQELKYLIIPF